MFRTLFSCLALLYSTYAQITFTQFPPDTIYPGNTYLTSWTLSQNQSFTETTVNLYSINGVYEQLARESASYTEFIWTVPEIIPEGNGFYLRVESTYANGTTIGLNTPSFSIEVSGVINFLSVCLIIIGITAMCCCAYSVRNRQQKHSQIGTPVPDTVGAVYVAPTCATVPPNVSEHTCATAPPPLYQVVTATPVYSVPHHNSHQNGPVVGVLVE